MLLTHEQAGFVRAFLGTKLISYAVDDLDCDLASLLEQDGFAHYGLRKSAVEALAAYDAEYVTVRRADVEATVALFESHSCCAPLEDVAANFRAALENK
jgi:hypothetical protein